MNPLTALGIPAHREAPLAPRTSHLASMADWQTYLQPQQVDEALAALSRAGGRGRVIAGGTDLLLDIAQGRHPPVDVLVDVAGIQEMRGIRTEGDAAWIGASATHASIAEHPVLRKRATALSEASGLIGGPQVRAVATLGGNVAHALPAADGTIALLALEADAMVASLKGRTRTPLAGLFAGPGATTMDRGRDILVGFRVPLTSPGEASAFVRVMRPQGVAIAILNMACWLRLSTDGRIETVRLACGPSGPTPRRCPEAEAALVGSSPESTDWPAAGRALLADVQFRTSPHRATVEYRRHVAEIVLRRVVTNAWQRAVEPVEEGA